MIFTELRKKEGRISGLVALERTISRKKRAKVKEFLLLVAPLIMMFALFFEEKAIIPLETLYGLTFLVIAAWLVIFMVDCFYYSHYFKGAHYSLPEWGTRSREKTIPYEVLEIVSHTEHADLTGGFLASNAGRAIMSRLDVPTDIVDSFIHSNRQKTYADPVIFSEPVTLVSYAEKVFAVDQSFVSFLTQHQINKNDFIDTADWVSSIYERKRNRIVGGGEIPWADFERLERSGRKVRFLFLKNTVRS